MVSIRSVFSVRENVGGGGEGWKLKEREVVLKE